MLVQIHNGLQIGKRAKSNSKASTRIIVTESAGAVCIIIGCNNSELPKFRAARFPLAPTTNNIINLLNYKVMATIKLNDVRKEFKNVNVATVGNVLSVIYSLVNEYKEKQKELSEEQQNNLQYLTKILPQSKTQAKKHIAEIEKYGNVNGKRVVKTKSGEPKEYTIRPSVDMVLRYFVAEYNKNIPEAKMEKKHIKHDSATRKPKECKDENKKTGNTMK